MLITRAKAWQNVYVKQNLNFMLLAKSQKLEKVKRLFIIPKAVNIRK